MNIAQILQLPDGVSGLTLEGTVGYCGAAKRITGEHNGKPYDFWSQFVTVKDDTGEVGVGLSVNSQADAVIKGQRISVEKGKIESYQNKDGKMTKKVQGKLAASSTFPGNVAPPQADNNKDASICRQCAGKCIAELCAGNDLTPEAFVERAAPIAVWFLTGGLPKQANPTREPGEEPQQEDDDSEIPF